MRGCFDVVVAESVDRLSRDQEHIAALFKHLSFRGIPQARSPRARSANCMSA
jgi:DNA invertase Pin-like site-specific DNA recombinase